MDNKYKSYGCGACRRALLHTNFSYLTRHILKLVIVVFCGISLLYQQGVTVPVLSGNSIKQIHDSQVVAYHYDVWSRLANRTFPNGVSTAYRYDEYSDVSNIIHYQTPQQLKVITGFTYVYEHDGSIAKRSRINELGQQAIERYGYDDDNNLKDYQCSGALCPHDAQGKVISYQHYTFDGLNNIKTVASNNTLTTYEYDQQIPMRLIRYHNSNPTYPISQKLRYDRNGNILQDDRGNLITYNPIDQTSSVSTRQGITTYFYNGEGQQVGETIPNRPATYFIYGQSHLLNTQEGSQQTSFLYGANRLGKQDDEGTQYYLKDQGGSVVNTVNQTQEQTQNINSYAYSPYGIESDLNKQLSKATPTQHFGFDGQLTDSKTNWQFLGQGYRAYNPMLHRFMSQDSMSPFNKGGINGYVFGSNNPIMMSDPTGHMSFWANMSIGLAMPIVLGMLTSDVGGLGILVINGLAGAVSSNIDAIDNAMHRKDINWKNVGTNAVISIVISVFFWQFGEENELEYSMLSLNKIKQYEIPAVEEIMVQESMDEVDAFPSRFFRPRHASHELTETFSEMSANARDVLYGIERRKYVGSRIFKSSAAKRLLASTIDRESTHLSALEEEVEDSLKGLYKYKFYPDGFCSSLKDRASNVDAASQLVSISRLEEKFKNEEYRRTLLFYRVQGKDNRLRSEFGLDPFWEEL